MQDRLLKAFWNSAAKGGLLTVLTDLHDSGFPGCTTDTMDYAAMAGHIHILYFLFIHREELCSTKAMNWACIYGRLEVVKFLYTFLLDYCNIEEATDIANLNGYQDIVFFLKQESLRKFETKNKRKLKTVTFAEDI